MFVANPPTMSIAPAIRFAAVLAFAALAAAAIACRHRISRHSDGKLAVHIWDSDKPPVYFDAWTQPATAESHEAALMVRVLGYTVEVWYADPKAATRDLLQRLSNRRAGGR